METNKILEDYGKIYFEKNLPDSCETCPFNYDTIGCNALTYGDRPEELTHCLDGDEGYKRRFSKCPLKQLAEKDKEIEMLDLMIKTLPEHDKEMRHQICEKIKQSAIFSGLIRDDDEVGVYTIEKDVLDQIEKGE